MTETKSKTKIEMHRELVRTEGDTRERPSTSRQSNLRVEVSGSDGLVGIKRTTSTVPIPTQAEIHVTLQSVRKHAGLWL